MDKLSIDLQKNFVVSCLRNILSSEINLEDPKSISKDYNDTVYLKVLAERLATNFDLKQ